MAPSVPSSSSSAAVDPLRGCILGNRFEVGEPLGTGATSTVYEAFELPKRNPVALKIMHARYAGDNQVRGRFKREATILRKLVGRHLCPILDFGEFVDPKDDRTRLLYLVLPKIAGRSLEALLGDHELLPIDRVYAIALDMCAALESAHQQGVIHRDLKPSNVMVDEHTDRVVVVDFGVAKILTGAEHGSTILTQHGMLFGTPEYMAPEQARGDDLDERCDIYAAGIIVYEMLTGHPPFEGNSPLAILTAQLYEAPASPLEAHPDRQISTALNAVVMHALTKERTRRYPSAAAFAEALTRAQIAPDDLKTIEPDHFEPFSSRRPAALVDGGRDSMIPQQSIRRPGMEIPLPTSRGGSRRAVFPWRNANWIATWTISCVIGVAVGSFLSRCFH